MQCDDAVRLINAYLDETLDEGRRREWRDHLRSCAGCREQALAEEPTLLLGLAVRPEPTPQQIEGCVRNVQAMIRQERLQRRLGTRSRPWLAAAAAAVFIIGAGIMIGAGPAWRLGSGPGLEDGRAVGSSQVAEDAILQGSVDRAGAAPKGLDEPAGATAGHQPAPEVRVDMDGEGVRVYHFAAAGDDDTTVAFIVNPALES